MKGRNMNTVELNNDLCFSYPEGFQQMSREDLGRHKFIEEAPGFCVHDEERHIMISVSWRQANPFVAMLVGSAEVSRNMEAKVRKPMSKFGYKLEEFITREVGGKTADGYRYTYNVKGTGMIGESLSVKAGSNFYYIHSYFREELRKESLKVLDEIFGNVTWKTE